MTVPLLPQSSEMFATQFPDFNSFEHPCKGASPFCIDYGAVTGFGQDCVIVEDRSSEGVSNVLQLLSAPGA